MTPPAQAGPALVLEGVNWVTCTGRLVQKPEAVAAAAKGVARAETEAAAAEAVMGAEAEAASAAAVKVAEAGDAAAGAMAAAETGDDIAGAVAGVETEVAGVEAATEAEGAVDGTEAEAGAAKAVAAAGDCTRADDANRARRAAEPESWWAVLDSSTKDHGVGGAVELGEALEAFAMSVEVAELKGDSQLVTERARGYEWWKGLEIESG